MNGDDEDEHHHHHYQDHETCMDMLLRQKRFPVLLTTFWSLRLKSETRNRYPWYQLMNR